MKNGNGILELLKITSLATTGVVILSPTLVANAIKKTNEDIPRFELSEKSITYYTSEDEMISISDKIVRGTVVIDAGHMGKTYDPGALTPFSDEITESDLTLMLAKKLQLELESKGYTVIMTREGNEEYISLSDRIYIGNRAKADYFISLHLNSTASGDPTYYSSTAQGIEIFISPEKDQRDIDFADILIDNLTSATGRPSRGIKYKDYYNSKVSATSVLIECGFMNNKLDFDYFTSEDGPTTFINAIVESIDFN